jgi:hypothetical protein
MGHGGGMGLGPLPDKTVGWLWGACIMFPVGIVVGIIISHLSN